MIFEGNKNFIIEWNNNFPLDHWWRKKYNIPFNSPKHREISYIDIYYEWLEEKMFEDYWESKNKEHENERKYQETGQWLLKSEKKKEIEKQELKKKFDDLDISALNNINNG